MELGARLGFVAELVEIPQDRADGGEHLRIDFGDEPLAIDAYDLPHELEPARARDRVVLIAQHGIQIQQRHFGELSLVAREVVVGGDQ